MNVTEIDRVREAHVNAVNNGDANAFAAVFNEDGIQMPPNSPANKGRDSIRAWCQGLFSAFETRFALNVDEVQGNDDWLFERGGYTITLTPRGGGGPISDAGKYITIYAKTPEGNWAVARDIWNSDAPLPGMK